MRRTYLAVLLAAFIYHPASATLGGPTNSIDTDRNAIAAPAPTTTTHSGYSVQEFVSHGTKIREFISPADKVFAIAWNGLTHPDLSKFLGTYYDEYKHAADGLKPEHGRKTRSVKSSNIIVERAGHMRNLRGRAYIPSLVPTGVNINEIN